MRTVLLHAQYTNTLSYFDDWIDAFKTAHQISCTVINIADTANLTAETLHKISTAELIISHHSVIGDSLSFIKPVLPALFNRNGKLVTFIGNEVNLPILGMEPRLELLQKLKPDIIATQLLQEAGSWLYAECRESRVMSIPHALNPHAFHGPKDSPERPTDIGTRSHKYGVMIGDDDRNKIIHKIEALSPRLNIDTGNHPGAQKRFNREEWNLFLGSCKATTSTEAGSFYLERDDATITAIENYLRSKSPKLVIPRDNIARRLYRGIIPSYARAWLRQRMGMRLIEAHELDQEDNFDEIWALFFSKAQPCPVYSKAISSRHFDAVGTRTLQVLFPGRYNDILRPHEHYFELRRDGANTEELISLLHNPKAWRELVDRTHDYVINHHTHRHRVSYLLKNIDS